MSETPERASTRAPSALPLGTRLGEFEVREVLGVGGFGIVYLAFDHALEREVALKEYMPQSMVNRTQTLHVSLRAGSDADAFAVGLRSFVNEARMLAHFNHPSLLKVHRFWEANGTAYMAMPLYRGRTLKDVAHELRGPPSDAWIRELLAHLGGALEQMHAEGTYHRDIAPDNILIEHDGRPVLLDFGAARRVLADRSQNLTAILKPSYAPIEQYAETSAIKQGPWTDLYALGATLHYMLLGKPPPPATTRALHDEMVPLAQQDVPGVGQPLRAIIDWMLAPRPADRLPSVAVLREALAGRVAPPAGGTHEVTVRVTGPGDAAKEAATSAAKAEVLGADMEATITLPKPSATLPPSRLGAGAGTGAAQATPQATEATVVLQREVPPRSKRKLMSKPAPPPPDAPATAAQAKHVPALLLLAIGGGAVLLALLWWVLQRPSQSTRAASPQAASASPQASAPAISAAASGVTAALPGVGPASGAAALPRATAATAGAASAARLGAAQPAASGAARAAAASPHRPAPTVPANVPTTPSAEAAAAPTTTRPSPDGDTASAARSAPGPAAAVAAPPPVVSPNAKCGGLNFLANFNCMRRECMAEPLNPHAECVAWRESGQNRVDPNSR